MDRNPTKTKDREKMNTIYLVIVIPALTLAVYRVGFLMACRAAYRKQQKLDEIKLANYLADLETGTPIASQVAREMGIVSVLKNLPWPSDLS